MISSLTNERKVSTGEEERPSKKTSSERHTNHHHSARPQLQLQSSFNTKFIGNLEGRNGAILDIGVVQANKFNETHRELWEYVSHEWKFVYTASLAIQNLKFPSYNKLFPPSGVNN